MSHQRSSIDFTLWPKLRAKGRYSTPRPLPKACPVIIYGHVSCFITLDLLEVQEELLLCPKLESWTSLHLIYINLEKGLNIPKSNNSRMYRMKKQQLCFLLKHLQEHSFVCVLLAITLLSPSVSQDVIGATVELPLWFRWEQFEKIGWEKVRNKSAEVHLVTADSLCVPLLSLITFTEEAGLGAQERSRPWVTLGFRSHNKAGLGTARHPIMQLTSASGNTSRKRLLQNRKCPIEAGNTNQGPCDRDRDGWVSTSLNHRFQGQRKNC